MGTKTSKWIKIITVLFIAVLLIWDANDRFNKRDTDSGIFFSLAAFSFILSAMFFFFQKRKIKSKEQSAQEREIVSNKTFLTIFIAIIILAFTIFQLFIRIDNYFEEIKEREEDKKEVIENHQRWMKEMNYHLANISEHHYLKTEYLDEKRKYQQFLKVIEINDSKIKLVKFYVRAFNPIPRLIEDSYTKDKNKDTIIIAMNKLKKTIFNTHEIGENTYRYLDSLRKDGLFYLIKDINYINGPFLSRHYEMAYGKAEKGNDTTYFTFENLNKKAILKDIKNISGNFKWHNTLPINVNGYKLNSNRNVEFELKATNVDFSKEYKFQLYFEDSDKNKHIFLVSKRFQDQPYFYESKRIFD